MTERQSFDGHLAVDMILDRISSSDTLTRSLNEQVIERVEKVEMGQQEIKGRIEQLERKDHYRDGQLNVQSTSSQRIFRVALVVIAAFAAGFAGSIFENNLEALPPTHKQDVSVQSPFKEDT